MEEKKRGRSGGLQMVEVYVTRCNNFTTIQTKGVKDGSVSLPYAFAEQGNKSESEVAFCEG